MKIPREELVEAFAFAIVEEMDRGTLEEMVVEHLIANMESLSDIELQAMIEDQHPEVLHPELLES